MNSEYLFKRRRINQGWCVSTGRLHTQIRIHRSTPNTTLVSFVQITFLQSSRVKCSWSQQNFNRTVFIASVSPCLCVGLTDRNLLRFNIRSIEVGDILCSNSIGPAGVSVSFCVALSSESKIVWSNSGVTIKGQPDRGASIIYSNLLYQQILGSYPRSCSCFIDWEKDGCEIPEISEAMVWVILNSAGTVAKAKAWICWP